MRFILLAFLFFISFCTITSAQWSQFGNPKGKAVDKIVFPTPSIGYAVTSDDNIIKTLDGGLNWTIAYQPPTATLGVYILNGLHFINATVGYAYGRDFWSSNYVIIKTTDGGVTWKSSMFTVAFNIGDFRNSDFPTETNGFVVGDLGYAVKTTNSGTSWQRMTLGTSAHLLDVDFVNTIEGFIATDNAKLFKTTNGGTTWTTISLQKSFNRLFFVNNQVGFAAGDEGVYKTSNGGTDWIHTGDTLLGKTSDLHFSDTLNGYALVNSRVWKTQDGGKKWHIQESKATFGLNQAAEINDFCFVDNNTAFASGFFYGDGNVLPLILKTTNGGGIAIHFKLSQNDLRCPYPSVLTAQSSFIGNPTQIDWYLDSTRIGNTNGIQNIPIPISSTSGYHKVFLKVQSGQNKIDLESAFTIEVKPDLSSVTLTPAKNPCKNESFRLMTNFRSPDIRVQLLVNNRVIAGPLLLSSFNASENYFDVPAISSATTYKIQGLTTCGVIDGGSVTITPLDLPNKTLSVNTTSKQLLCGNDHQADIILSNSQPQTTYFLYQNGYLNGNEQVGGTSNLTFEASTFNNTAQFSILAIAANGCQVFLTDTVEIRVEHPSAEFVTNGLNLPVGTPVNVSFTGKEAAKYAWKFGSKAAIAVSNAAQPSAISYFNADSTEIELIVTASLGCQDTFMRKVGFFRPNSSSKIWGQEANLSEHDFIKGQNINVDNNNNIILTGRTNINNVLPSKLGIKGNQKYDGSAILKYDPQGTLLWHVAIEGQYHKIIHAKPDNNNNIVVACKLAAFSGEDKTTFYSLDGKQKAINNHNGSAIVKYNTNGVMQWIAEIQVCNAIIDLLDVEKDAQGNIYILANGVNTWSCQSTVKFISADGSIKEVGNIDNTFIAKLDPNGRFIWAKPLLDQNSNAIYANRIKVDRQGNLYIAGGDKNILLKLDALGNNSWSVRPTQETTGFSNSGDLALDSLGNIYIGGYFYGKIQYSGLLPIESTTGTGIGNIKTDLFLLKVDPTGKPLWLKAGNTDVDYSENTALQYHKGSLYVSSFFVKGLTYDSTNIKGQSYMTAFLLKVRDSDGKYQAHYALDKPNPNGDETRYISLGNTLSINSEGYFHWIGELGYEATFGTDKLTHAKWLYIARFNPFSTVITSLPNNLDNTDIQAVVYPNPSLKNTTLKIKVEATTHASIKVTDVSGKIIQHIHDKTLNNGINEIPLTSMASGIHFVVIQTSNGYSQTIRWLTIE
jgi:photosystem II stability/assembly factor-like uncharacterized protein